MDVFVPSHVRHISVMREAEASGQMTTVDRARTPIGTSTRTRVLVLHEHLLVADAIARSLDATDGLHAVTPARLGVPLQVGGSSFDLALIGRSNGGTRWLELASAVRDANPAAALLLLHGGAWASLDLHDLVARGFRGVLGCEDTVDDLVRAIATVVHGGTAFPASLVHAVGDPVALTARERSLLQLLASPMTYREIGTKIFLSENTIRKHVQSILQKVGAHSRLEAVLVARRLGLVDLDEPGSDLDLAGIERRRAPRP